MVNVKTILHPTDFSEQANYAFQLASALARDYDARLLLLFVEQPPAVVYGEFGTLPAEPAGAEETFKRQLFNLKPDDERITVEHLFQRGDPAPEIVRLAQEQDVDLIVMGTHGRGWLGRLLMGSVAEQVVRNAPCPVLTVKTPFERIANAAKAAKTAKS